jgi:DNA polymerase III sliding clamp (beta) subunit (PCNA family)
MKSKISRILLEIALSKCFEAGEKKTSESLTFFQFENNILKLTTKGAFTFYETSIEGIDCEKMSFTLKTSAILEFVKYISSDEIIIVFDETKNSCLVSSADKKSKIAFQVTDEKFEDRQSADLSCKFTIANLEEFILKLNFSSKFCSNNIDDYPLTGIHCNIKQNNFELKSTNGPSFYQTNLEIDSKDNFEFYLHKKSPNIIKNVLTNESVKTFGVNNKYFYIETEKSKLKIFIEKCEQNSFPSQITDLLDKEKICSMKISAFEFSKTLKYLNGIIPNATSKIVCQNNVVTLEASQLNFAAKETLAVETLSGEVGAAYNTKYLIDCLDALPFSWVNIDFMLMQDSFFICKISHDSNIALLCPDLS